MGLSGGLATNGTSGGGTPAVGQWTFTVPFVAGLTADNPAHVGTWATALNTSCLFNGYIQNTGNQNDAISVDLSLDAGTWNLVLVYAKAANGGIITFNLDGSSLGTLDTYSGSTSYANVTLAVTGFTVATSGKHTLQFLSTTKNGSSGLYQMTMSAFTLRRTA